MSNLIFYHRTMLADKVRMTAYLKAIKEVVKKGDIVCDIGTGSGILAFFSLRMGAKRVYAIERNDIIEEAKKLAHLNRLKGKITFIKGMSDKVRLPEKADIIVSELMGSFGIEEYLPKFKIDARKRFLKPGGKLIPSWLELYLVPVEFRKFWQKNIGIWNKDFYGLDFSSAKDFSVSQSYVTDCSNKVRFLSSPSSIAHFDFYKNEKGLIQHNGKFTIEKIGTLHGFVGYFKVGLSKKVTLSNSPLKPPTHWGHIFFPVQNEVRVKKRDEVSYKIKAIPQKHNIFWQWETKILRNKIELASFNHTNFNITKEELTIGRPGFKPMLTKEAKIQRRILDLCDGNRTVEKISEYTFKENRKKYRTIKDAIEEVVGIVRGKVKVK